MEFQSTGVKYLIFVRRNVENILSGVLNSSTENIP